MCSVVLVCCGTNIACQQSNYSVVLPQAADSRLSLDTFSSCASLLPPPLPPCISYLTATLTQQSSVWGSGSAGIFCAFMALLTGNYDLWQVCVWCGCSAQAVCCMGEREEVGVYWS